MNEQEMKRIMEEQDELVNHAREAYRRYSNAIKNSARINQ
jgi:hypothetical protein